MTPIDKQQEQMSLKMAQSVMKRFLPSQMLWHYEHGLVLQSIYEVAKNYKKTEFFPWIQAMYDTKINDDGSIVSYKKDDFNLDQINPGKLLFDLYDETKKNKYRLALEILRLQLSEQPRTQSGGFWHKKIYPWQMWLDGLYMAEPFYARYSIKYGNDSDFDDILNQFELAYSHTGNPNNGLLYHAWDESCKQLWADSDTGCSPHFWGRAMGWYCMALTDVISLIDKKLANEVNNAETNTIIKKCKERLSEIAGNLVSPVINFQDKQTGLWYQVLDMAGRSGNYLESSCSAMFTAFLFRIVRFNLLPAAVSENVVMDSARKGYSGLLSRITQDSDGELHLGGICSVAGLGGKPYRDGSYSYYVKEKVVADDFKGVGPFILASLESEYAEQR